MGKDQPPDLAALVPSETIALPDFLENKPSSETLPQNHTPVGPKPKEVKGNILDYS